MARVLWAAVMRAVGGEEGTVGGRMDGVGEYQLM